MGPAKLTGSSLGVRVKVKQRTRVKLTAVNRKQRAKVAKATLAKGRHRFKAQLPAALLRPGLQLRTVAKNLVTGKKATGRLKIRVPVAGSAPTDITLAPAAVAENLPPGQVVGTLAAVDPDAGDTHAFSVITGPFTVVGTSLRTTVALDTEASPSQAVRVRATDARGLTYEKDLTVTITNVNEAPTSLALDPRSVEANQPAGATVGTLTATDPDQFDTRTFALAAGAGDTDNALFAVDGILLKTKAPLPASPATRSVRLKVTDAGGLSFEQVFSITVKPGGGGGGTVNSAPVVTTSAGNAAFPTGGAPVAIDPGLTVADADSPQLQGARVSITTGLVAAEDALAFTNQSGITGAYDAATGVLTLTGSATVADYQAALRTVTYANSAVAPTLAPRTVEFRVTDAQGTHSNLATRNVNVTGPNAKPVADDDTVDANDSAHGNTTMVVDDPSDAAPNPSRPHSTVTGEILDGDTDADGPGPLTVTPGTFATNDGGSVTLEADGDFVYEPAPGTSCTDTSDFFDYTVEDGGNPVQTDTGRVTIAIAGCVWYVSNNAPGNAGTSAAPFDTLAQAEAASGPGHTVFVFDGDDTSTGLTSGYALAAGERLIGEHSVLVVDPDQGGPLTPDTLFAGNPGARPTLTATDEDVIDLDDANEVRGLVIDPAGAGGGIAGGAGDTGGATIADVNIVDTATAGTQPGLELDGTAGTYTVSDLNVTTVGATGVRLNSAGTVDLDAGSLTTTGARVLDAAGTNMATSAIGALTATGSSTGGLRMSATTGTTTLGDGTGTDLALTTTSGVTPALQLANAGTVTIDAAGSDDISATNGPAVDIVNTTGGFAFDGVSSANSASDGINLDGLGASSFSAASGSVTGAAGVGFDLDKGSGTVTYPGAISTMTGQAVDITGRTGGAVTLGGAITDSGAGIGINLANNVGTTTFSGAGTNLSTGSSPAVSATNPGTVAFTGGNLHLVSTTGTTFRSTGTGTVTVTGAGNRLISTLGTALDVSGTTIGAADLNFTEIDAANPVLSGILLANTGNDGGLTVSGSAGACTSAATCTGGAIQSADAAGISLTNVGGGVALTRMFVGNGLTDGIAGSAVNGLVLDNVVVASNGDAVNENGLDFTGLTGTVTLTAPTITGNAENNVSIVNDAGTLNATVTGGRIAANSQTVGNDGILVNGTGAGTMNLNIQNTAFEDNRGDHVQMTTDATTTVVQNLVVNNTTMNTTPAADPAVVGGGITVNPGGNAVTEVALTNNNIQQAFDSAITIDTPGSAVDPQPAQVDVTITGNTIGTAAAVDSGSESANGITLRSNGMGDVDALISGNTIRQYSNLAGIDVVQNDGNGTLDLTARGNTIGNPGTFATNGILVRSGLSGGTETGQNCLDLGHPTDPALKNAVFGSGANGGADIRVRHLSNSTVRLAGYTGGQYATADVISYLQARNNANGVPTVTATSSGTGGGFQTVAGCTLP